MPELIGSFFILKVITLFSLRRDGWRGVLQALNRSHIVTSSPLPLGVPTNLRSSYLPLGVPTDLQSSYPPLGVPTDLQSVVKKWPNLFIFCGFAIRSRGECYVLWIRGLQIPWFDRSNIFLWRIANPSGRLTGYGTAGEGGFQGTKKVVES